jgi:hypothetical protein
MPNKTWAVGEEVLAPDFNTYVQQQVIAQFPTVAARNTGIASPVGGQASYVDAGDATEGPEFWNGVAWRKAWSMPWGTVAFVGGNNQWTGITNIEQAMISSPAFAAPGNRRYRITVNGTISGTVAGDQARFAVRRDTGVAGTAVQVGPVVSMPFTNGLYGGSWVAHDIPPANPTQVYTLCLARIGGTGGFAWLGTTYTNFVLVEDVGPAGNPL